MRTTVDIDQYLLHQLRKRAHETGTSFKEILSVVIRRGLAAETRATAPDPYVMPTHDFGEWYIDVTKATTIAFEDEDRETLRKMGLLD
jgi:hypothetical protein